MKWSTTRKSRKPSATQVAMNELAKQMMTMRRHSQPVPQELEVQYRELLAKNYAELRKEAA